MPWVSEKYQRDGKPNWEHIETDVGGDLYGKSIIKQFRYVQVFPYLNQDVPLYKVATITANYIGRNCISNGIQLNWIYTIRSAAKR